jgi:hypothetical protein
MNYFLIDYQDAKGDYFTFRIQASSFEEAEGHLEAIKKSGVVVGELVEEGVIPSGDDSLRMN